MGASPGEQAGERDVARQRFAHALDFLGAALDPPAADAALAPLHAMIANLRKRAGLS